MTAPHETRTKSGITIPDPDQGTPYLLLNCAMPSTSFQVYEPFEDGTEGGHNLYGFLRRWKEWALGSELFLMAQELRFGHPMAIPRAALEPNGVVGISVAYHRKEDARAGFRGSGLQVPGSGMRRLPNGDIEIRVPR
jgi:hypothetical protein